MNHKNDSKPRLKAITVRLRGRDYALLREYAEKHNTSMNSVLSEAITEYGAKIQRKQALDRIQRLQRRLRQHKLGSDSVELLREMREKRTQDEVKDEYDSLH